MDVFDRTIQHQQTMFNIKICPFIGRAFESLLHESSVVGMNSLERQLQCWLCHSIVLEDLVGLLRPVDLSSENAPAEAAGLAYALPLSQVSLTALQIRKESRIPRRNRGCRSHQPQTCEPSRG